jgi:DNA-binding transcriptional LysR family regulator
MEINQLRHFLAVYDNRSMGRAARHLGMTQPALSQSIRRLEELFGVKLFERTARGVTPTQFAESFIPHARNISLEARGAIQDIEALRGLERGNVVIAASPGPSASIVPESIKRLHRVRPHLRITVIEGTSDSVIAAVCNGEADIGILPEWKTRKDYELAGEPLMFGMMVVVAGRLHPLHGARRIDWDDVLGCSWILAPQGDLLRLSFEDIVKQLGRTPPVPAVESASASVIRNLLTSGEFLSFLPRDFIINEERDGSLVPLRIAGCDTWKRDLFILYRQRDVLSPAALALIQQLRNATGDLAREVGWIGVPMRRRRGRTAQARRASD